MNSSDFDATAQGVGDSELQAGQFLGNSNLVGQSIECKKKKLIQNMYIN